MTDGEHSPSGTSRESQVAALESLGVEQGWDLEKFTFKIKPVNPSYCTLKLQGIWKGVCRDFKVNSTMKQACFHLGDIRNWCWRAVGGDGAAFVPGRVLPAPLFWPGHHLAAPTPAGCPWEELRGGPRISRDLSPSSTLGAPHYHREVRRRQRAEAGMGQRHSLAIGHSPGLRLLAPPAPRQSSGDFTNTHAFPSQSSNIFPRHSTLWTPGQPGTGSHDILLPPVIGEFARFGKGGFSPGPPCRGRC